MRCACSYCQDYSQVLFVDGVCRAGFGGGFGSLMAISGAEFAESIPSETFTTTYHTFLRLSHPLDPPIPLYPSTHLSSRQIRLHEGNWFRLNLNSALD